MANESFSKQVGAALRSARVASGLTLTNDDEVKARTGYSKAQISNWETGRIEPRLSSLNKLAAAYSTTPVDIVAAATSPTPPTPTGDETLEERVARLEKAINQSLHGTQGAE